MDRLIILFAALAIVLLTATGNLAQDTIPEADGDTTHYAPRATGGVAPGLIEMLERAETLAKEIEANITVQSPADWTPPVDLEAVRTRALDHPRVRALLHGGSAPADLAERNEDRWNEARAFVFASFSMPPASLEALMGQARTHGVPVVFRGFVNNSVYDTRDALLSIFETDAEIEGFSIDPTLFVRFDIKAVPVAVAVGEIFGACETRGCAGDAAPAHDRVAGNIPLGRALEIIAKGEGPGAAAAQDHLERGAK